VTEQPDPADGARPPGGPQRTDQPGPGLGKVRDTDGAGRTDARDPEATDPVGDPGDSDPADQSTQDPAQDPAEHPADDGDQEAQP
jgi:hypothetical protein